MRDFTIIAKAERYKRGSKYVDEGYIVEYAGDKYFIFDGDDGRTIDDCEFWTLDIERHWCFCDLNVNDGYTYFSEDNKIIDISTLL